MVEIIKRAGQLENASTVIEAQVSTQAELTTDADCIACGPGSTAVADDLSFAANKKNNGTWNIVTTGLV